MAEGKNVPPRCHRLLKKKPRARFGVPLYMMLLRGVSCSLHGHRTWKSQAGTDLEASILLASSHSAGRFSPNCWGRSILDSLIQLRTPWATIMTNQPGKVYRGKNDGINVTGVISCFMIIRLTP